MSEEDDRWWRERWAAWVVQRSGEEEDGKGQILMRLTAGEARWRDAGILHAVLVNRKFETCFSNYFPQNGHKNTEIYSLLCCSLDEITASFRRFGPLIVDWPHKAESKSYFPPKGNLRGSVHASSLSSQRLPVRVFRNVCVQRKLFRC